MSGTSLPLMTRLGNYELVRLLAQGGMADIYLARQTGLDRLVAVKVLSSHRANDAEAAALFMDEARLVGMLAHANLAGVFEVAADEGVHYLAMEYVHGCDLRELLGAAHRQRAAVPYEAAVAIAMAAASGLDHAHRRCGPDGRPLHLVHRDVSLSNIMVSHEGAVKVIDFGIAHIVRTALAADPADRFASCAAMIEALERVCSLEGWDASTAAVAGLMNRLFGVQTPVAEVADPTQPVVVLPPAERTRVITRPRRFPRGTESDVCEDEAPTRGRRSLSRMWSPLAA